MRLFVDADEEEQTQGRQADLRKFKNSSHPKECITREGKWAGPTIRSVTWVFGSFFFEVEKKPKKSGK
jgi:hypothetical protein